MLYFLQYQTTYNETRTAPSSYIIEPVETTKKKFEKKNTTTATIGFPNISKDVCVFRTICDTPREVEGHVPYYRKISENQNQTRN